MNEKELNELLAEDTIDKDLQKKIKRKMNQNIYSKALITLIVCCLGFGALYYGSSLFLNITNYNPHDEEKDFETFGANTNGFSYLYSTYLQLRQSGQRTYGVWETKDLGFGKYQIEFQIEDSFKHSQNTYWEFRPNYIITIDNGKFDMSSYSTDSPMGIESTLFKNPKDNIQPASQFSFKQIYDLVNELPSSSYIDASISFKNLKSMEDIANLINAYPNAVFDWIALDNQDIYFKEPDNGGKIQPSGYIGMSLNDSSFTFSDDLEQYPCLSLYRREITAITLKHHYLSSLKLLLDHPDFLDVLNRSLVGQEDITKALQRNYENAQNELNAYGVRVFAKKDDLIKMMDQLDITYIKINNEKSSIFSK